MKRSPPRGLLAVCVLLLAGCVQGDGPTGLGAPRSVALAVLPLFESTPSAAVVASLDSARVALIDMETDSVIAEAMTGIDPANEEWTFELTVELLEDQVLNVRLDVELIDGDPIIDVTEFAGRTEFDVRASFEPTEIRQINLGRGPLENLSLTSLRVTGARSRIQEGGSDVLELDTIGAMPGQTVFFESTDSVVARVDSLGNIRALVPGNALIIARAGRVADTLNLTVGQVNLPSAQTLQSTLTPHVAYVTDAFFLGSMSDGAAAAILRESVDALVTEMLAGRGFESVGLFERAQADWEAYGEGTSLRFFEGPQLGVIAIALMHAADALGIDFL